MKCLKQVFFILLLTALLVSPLYAGWDGFKSSLSDSSNGSSEDVAQTTTEQASQTESSTEAIVESKQTDKLLENLDDNSANYDAKLAEAQDAIDEAENAVAAELANGKAKKAEEKRDAVEKAQDVVDDLIASKAALDEDHAILVDTVVNQQRVIAKQARQLDGINFGLGGMYNQTVMFDKAGLDAIGRINPNLLFGVRYKNWEVLFGVGAVLDFNDGWGNAFRNMNEMTVSIGGVYWF